MSRFRSLFIVYTLLNLIPLRIVSGASLSPKISKFGVITSSDDSRSSSPASDLLQLPKSASESSSFILARHEDHDQIPKGSVINENDRLISVVTDSESKLKPISEAKSISADDSMPNPDLAEAPANSSDRLESLTETSTHHGEGHNTFATDPSSMQSSHNTELETHRNGGHHHHHHHGPALEHLNETLILETHAPDPPSYFDLEQTDQGKGGWLIAHIVTACLAFFFLLPLTIFVKGGGSPLAVIPQTAFLFFSVLSSICGSIYNAATPNMYEGSSHSKLGWLVILAAIGINILDVLRLMAFSIHSRVAKKQSYQLGLLGNDNHACCELDTLLPQGQAEVQSPLEEPQRDSSSTSEHSRAQFLDHPQRASSSDSNDTLFESAEHEYYPRSSRSPTSKRYLSTLTLVGEIILIVFGYVELLSGIAVFTGSCREAYLNGCLAHLIKGSIFFGYGLLTFARYIGAFSAYGWAWNRHPSGTQFIWTAEFVESLICFIYGSTNVWLERLGKGDSPWSVKDVQHASIALMFWFAGLLGMLIESRKLRSLLSTTAIIASGREEQSITGPASASFSFNPFPAIVVGTTGIAMSAHAQTYVFQVTIHALWGLLLALFSLSRFLTYFFLYLRPPASILPSRPPTEALASLFLCSGGVVFILSTEQVTFATMRHGWDDVMAFLNVTVSFVSILFVWIFVLFAIQGAILRRRMPGRCEGLNLKA